MSLACSNYEITESINNMSFSTQQNVTIWYKKEIYLELFKQYPIPMTTEVPLTTQAGCPDRFVLIGSGCFYADTDGMEWQEGETICRLIGDDIGHESRSAYFDDITVSKHW